MPVSALAATKSLCEMRHWSIPQLAIQKILYIAQMTHLGRYRTPLLHEKFLSSHYGPIIPIVAEQIMSGGNEPVQNIFRSIPSMNPDTTEYHVLHTCQEMTRNLPISKLVEASQKPYGAWSSNYTGTIHPKTIPNRSIHAEYLLQTTRLQTLSAPNTPHRKK